MRIDVLTLFPTMFSPLFESIINKALEKGIISINIHNIRDHSTDKHKSVDDMPYGGGAGMVLKPEPLFDAISSLKNENKGSKVIMMSPAGRLLDQGMSRSLSREKGLIIICGHYEGIDERVRQQLVDEEISVGDYVLTGGELPAMSLIDSVSRLIPGVLGNEESKESDSFSEGLLEGPHFTRPEEYAGMKVPEVLLSGNHKEIDRARRKESLKKTLFNRPQLFSEANLVGEDRILLNEIIMDVDQ